MTSSKIAAVVVGTGFGLFTHVRALRDAGFEVRAIVGRDLEKTRTRSAPSTSSSARAAPCASDHSMRASVRAAPTSSGSSTVGSRAMFPHCVTGSAGTR